MVDALALVLLSSLRVGSINFKTCSILPLYSARARQQISSPVPSLYSCLISSDAMSRAFLSRLNSTRKAREFPKQNSGKIADFYEIQSHNELGKSALPFRPCPSSLAHLIFHFERQKKSSIPISFRGISRRLLFSLLLSSPPFFSGVPLVSSTSV